MSGTGPGELDGAEGVAERGDSIAARIELSDARVQETIEVPMPGGQVGEKPGRITGVVGIRFIETEDAELREHLDKVAARERTNPVEFDLRLDDGRRVDSCSVAGPLGSDSGAFWFTLNI